MDFAAAQERSSKYRPTACGHGATYSIFCTPGLFPHIFARFGSKALLAVANLGLLFITVALLRTLTSLPWSTLVIVVALSLPLRVNFRYGQYYLLLLFLLTLAYWLYARDKRFLAGVVTGITFGLKIFPVVYLLYFIWKRDIKAFAGGIAGGLVAASLSVFVFGWELHRTYLFQVLLSALRGEGLDLYNLKAGSISSLLHRLFIDEPQLNLHPAVNAPWLFAIVHPLLQIILIAPALLLIVPGFRGS